MANKQPVIVKKIFKGGGGHSGGAWKIAYADFVTAMMAFFLLLWLLNSVTQEQLSGVSDYFAPVSDVMSPGGSDGLGGGKTLAEEGAAETLEARESVVDDLDPPKAGNGGESLKPLEEIPAEETEEQKKEREELKINEAVDELEQSIASSPQLKRLKDSLLVDNTPEGLRIQLIDQDGLALFPSGSAEMFLHTKKLLEVVVKVIKDMPQNISITGHTDAVPYVTKTGYSNWELSVDRANAARRQLVHYKIANKRMNRVVGRSFTEPLLEDDPRSPRNRRLEIILLRGTGEDAKSTNLTKQTNQLKELALPGLNELRKKQLDEDNN